MGSGCSASSSPDLQAAAAAESGSGKAGNGVAPRRRADDVTSGLVTTSGVELVMKEDGSPWMSERQAEVIRECWGVIQTSGQAGNVAVMTFKSMFELHPDAIDHFTPFRHVSKDGKLGGSDSQRYLKTLQAHALRAMSLVDKICARLDNESQCFRILNELGVKHVAYNAKPDLMPVIGEQFIYALSALLATESCLWTEEHQQAWRVFFYCIISRLHAAMRTELEARMRSLQASLDQLHGGHKALQIFYKSMSSQGEDQEDDVIIDD